jgi:hypothetical protein
MHHLGVVRALSRGLARLTGGLRREGSGGSGGQDKSRKLRRGRGGEEHRKIKHLGRGAGMHDSLPIGASSRKFKSFCTSRTSAS